jgi:Aspartyl protease
VKRVYFPNSAALTVATATPRPEAHLVLVGISPSPDHVFGYVLIDSGADYVVLPEKAGLSAGIALPPRATTTLHGVGGSVGAAMVRGVSLEFETLRITADVMFDYTNTVGALFGRSGIRVLQDIGIDDRNWHWNP